MFPSGVYLHVRTGVCVYLCNRRSLDYIKELSFDPLEMKPSAVSVYQTSVISSTTSISSTAFLPRFLTVCGLCVSDVSFFETISDTG